MLLENLLNSYDNPTFLYFKMHKSKKIQLETLLKSRSYWIIGVLFELLILVWARNIYSDPATIFQISARFSGRLSLLYFLLPWWLYILENKRDLFELLHKPLKIFAVLHLVHFVFLALNVYLNAIPLIPVKLIGGMLGYIMIIFIPFFRNPIKSKKKLYDGYFLYVGIIMIATYISRINGDFEGSIPSPVHYIGITTLGITMFIFLLFFFKNKMSSKKKSL